MLLDSELRATVKTKITMPVETTLLWIKDELVRKVVKADKSDTFKDVEVETCDVTAMEGNKDNWASIMFSANITVRGIDKKLKTHQVLIKIMDENEDVRALMHLDKQFSNEIHLYSVVLPYVCSLRSDADIDAIVSKMVPKCFYTSLQKPIPNNPRLDDGVIVMENLANRNYKLGNRTFLDLTHCNIAMDTLGSFHALSYFTKERNLDSFKNTVVGPIEETNYAKDNVEMARLIFPIAQRRVLDMLDGKLGSATPERSAGIERLRAIYERDPYDLLLDLVKPVEPLAVLCHGDFLRNNVLFRYEDAAAVDMKLIDFQTIRYASPAIDISLFIGMNTSHELRSEHFEQLLLVYHNSLRRTLAALLGVSEQQLPQCYDFDVFLKDFREHALYGYIISIDFMPWMMAEEKDLAEYVHLFKHEMFSPEFKEKTRILAGEAATKVNTELAEDLIDFGCI